MLMNFEEIQDFDVFKELFLNCIFIQKIVLKYKVEQKKSI